ncbi:GTP-binding protein [Waterburya agarophytonicola K14]|uniref:GTP-binding protein n=1 Tax=Waterburya agarophytonicola KI4 TaxID=2874699 RepID=A0A964FG59_9CYAN|nr:Rab family GTPase [Waterburya agarophytonicola]MCC0176173.1 GTP-binding protein [Waterburya agarophytonicola KI4]
MSTITKKICLLGNFNVGKTSLIRRFVENKFSDQYLSTVGVKISRKSIEIETELDLHQINLMVWDLEGNTKFKPITPSYLKGASGSIIVADLTRVSTLENINQHADLFLKINPQGTIAIALNKADLVPQEKLDRLLENYGCYDNSQILSTYPTSAKTGDNVAEIFRKLSYSII